MADAPRRLVRGYDPPCGRPRVPSRRSRARSAPPPPSPRCRRPDRGSRTDRTGLIPPVAHRDLPSHRPGTTAGTHARHRRCRAGAAAVHHPPCATPRRIAVSPLLDEPLLDVTAADQVDERPVALRELATDNLGVPPPTTDCGQATLHACHQPRSHPRRATPPQTSPPSSPSPEPCLEPSGETQRTKAAPDPKPLPSSLRTGKPSPVQRHSLPAVGLIGLGVSRNPLADSSILSLRSRTRDDR